MKMIGGFLYIYIYIYILMIGNISIYKSYIVKFIVS